MVNDLNNEDVNDILEQIKDEIDNNTPGTKEYSILCKDYVEMTRLKADIKRVETDMNDKAERLDDDKKKSKNDNIHKWADTAFKATALCVYAGGMLVLLKFNLAEGSLRGKDGMKMWDAIGRLMKM